MSMTDDRLTELRQQLTESVARLAELEAAAIDAMVEGKGERDISAIETRKSQTRDRIALLQQTIKQLERQRQLDAQAFMLAQEAAFMGPLVAPLDQASGALALPPHVPDKPVKLEPETIKPKQSFRWFGNPREGGASRWNNRAR
jgi:hypothetical protein